MKKLILFVGLLAAVGLPVCAMTPSSSSKPETARLKQQHATVGKQIEEDTEHGQAAAGQAEYCYIGNVTLESQADVNNFIQSYGHCTALGGRLTLKNISDLSFLEDVTTISQGLHILDSPSLTGLNHLQNLTSVGDLEISNCPNLTSLAGISGLTQIAQFTLNNVGITSLSGLENLNRIGGGVYITQMPALTSLAGLSSLNFANAIQVSDNPLLTTFNSFQSLTSVGVYIHISDNPLLASLNAFQNLVSVGSATNSIHYLQISGSPLLTSLSEFLKLEKTNDMTLSNLGITNLDGLEKLVHLTGGLTISDNPSLTGISGFQDLTRVEKSLRIHNNPILSTLNGFQNLTLLEQDLLIHNNPALTALSGFQSLTTLGGQLEIQNDPSLTPVPTAMNGFQNLASIGSAMSLYNLGFTTLNGLGKLESIGAGLSIERLPYLTSVEGLSALSTVGTFINVVNNAALSTCALEVFCQKLADSPDNVGLWGNADGCESNEQVSDACAALPVMLARFEVKPGSGLPEGRTAHLSWATASEANSDYFEIQHTTDIAAWDVLGRVASEGESTTLLNYAFSHSAPPGGLNYYRLRMVDKDGAFEYSPIRSLRFDAAEELLAYPNPATDRFRLRSPAGVKRLEIFSVTGICVLTVAEIPSEGVDLSHLSVGQYIVKATRKDGSFVSRKINIVR